MKLTWSKLLLPIILATLAVSSEYLHLLFTGVIHSEVVNETGNKYNVYLDDAVWYLMNALFVFALNITVLILLDKKNLAAKIIMSGVVFWFFVELIESILFFAKVNINMLFINDWSWFQVFSMFFVVLLSWYGLARHKS